MREIQNICEMSIRGTTVVGCKEKLLKINDSFLAREAISPTLR